MSSLNSPVSTSVIALDVPTAPTPIGTELLAHFQASIVDVLQLLGALTTETGNLNLTLTLPPDGSIDTALQRAAAAITSFEERCNGMAVRAIVHCGVVFRSQNAGKTSFVGSAIRSAQSTLRRAPATPGLFGTRDFATWAESHASPAFEVQVGTGEIEELHPIRVIGRSEIAARPSTALPSSDPELLLYLKKRLAADLGPFSGPLVDNAKRAAGTANQLVTALAHEVDNPTARQRFTVEALHWIKAHAKR